LSANTADLIRAGTRSVLVEKPAGLDPGSVAAIADLAAEHEADVSVAYNRRFLASTEKAREIIAADGGATSLRMEFSEFSVRIAPLASSAEIKAAWVYANSSHVLDMGFSLAGFPKSLSASAFGALDWHPAGSQFVGHGLTDKHVPFSYHADWEGAPRWMVEVSTPKRTLMLQPLEQLKQRRIDGFKIESVEIDDELDTRFKPGIWRQTQAFLTGEGAENLCLLSHHAVHMRETYQVIRNGGAHHDS